MTPDPEQIPLSNHVTDAADKLETPSLVIRSDGTPIGTNVALTDGTKLGIVQSVEWALTVQGYATCTVTTMATPAQLKTLGRDTTIALRPAADYHPVRYLWDWYTTKVWRWFKQRGVDTTTTLPTP